MKYFQEELSSTHKGYQEQLTQLTEHVAELNAKLTRDAEDDKGKETGKQNKGVGNFDFSKNVNEFVKRILANESLKCFIRNLFNKTL